MRASRESKWMGAPASPPVVVLGAGFAGLRAVRRLGGARVDTLWVDARNYHCFLPLLYQVATAGLEPQDIAYPARSILRRLRAVDFRLARVAAGDPAAQILATASGEHIAYSHLIVCTGGAAEDFGIPGVREHAFHLYDLDDARALRNHVLRTLERAAVCADPAARAALLTFVIVGAGATGVEMGGALAEFRRHVVPRDYRTVDPAALRLVVLEAGENVLRARRGEPLLPFRYADKGAMATIGRSRAVAVVKGVHLQGRLAWWAWLVVHLVMLIGFRNRLVVLVNWAWNYFTYDRGLRAIVGEADEAGGPGTRAPGPA